jgi:putative ABC transport system substrate-binding protein
LISARAPPGGYVILGPNQQDLAASAGWGLRMFKRREFICILGTAAALWPFAADAQQSDRVRRIGVLMGFAENDEVWQTYLATFKQRLRDFGWSEGRNVRIDVRFSGENNERIRGAAEELIADAPDVLFVSTNPVVTAVMRATPSIPIVFTWVSDSVGSGFVMTLARPGGRMTGFHNFEPAFGGKWLEVLKQIAPGMRRVAVLHVPEIAANVALMHAVETASAALGITVSPAAVREVADIERVLTAFAREPNGGVVVTPSPLTATRRDAIIEVAAHLGLPAIYPFRFYASSGGLVAYGNDQLEQVREAASYVDRILRGANPGELPVQLPTKFQLAINLKTAKALGITVPNSMLLLADDVIE